VGFNSGDRMPAAHARSASLQVLQYSSIAPPECDLSSERRPDASAPSRTSCAAAHPGSRTAHGTSGPALVVVGPRADEVGCSREAGYVLCYPAFPASERELHRAVTERVSRLVLGEPATSEAEWTTPFVSGRRRYDCYGMRVNGLEAAYMVLRFERVALDLPSFAAMCSRFHLTGRESEAVALLAHGLTNKEIAARMTVSANTVKAFLHLVMSKMGVSTRAGILGRVLGQ
jgi:DNA-binding CsgD family transcriptional regulator